MNFALEVLPKTRHFFNRIIEKTSVEDLNKIPKGFNNNIIWNIGHVVVTQQLLVYKLSGLPMMVSNTLVERYKKGTKPEGDISQEEINEIKSLLFSTIEKTKEDYIANAFQNYQEYTVSTTGNTLSNVNDALDFVHFHEGMHFGYVLAQLRTLKN